MTVLRALAILSGAAALPAVTIWAGLSLFLSPPSVSYAGAAILLALTVYFVIRRSFFFAGVYLLSVVFLLFSYPRFAQLEAKGREGGIKGGLSQIRTDINMAMSESGGAYPPDLSFAAIRPLRLPHHGTSSEVLIVRLPPEAYSPPIPGWKKGTLRLKRAEDGWEAVLPGGYVPDWPPILYPGRYSYRAYGSHDSYSGGRAPSAEGEAAIPAPDEFVQDSGTYVYDPSTGYVFINCTHKLHQKETFWWFY